MPVVLRRPVINEYLLSSAQASKLGRVLFGAYSLCFACPSVATVRYSSIDQLAPIINE